MSELQIFSHPDFGQVRTVTTNEGPWFVGKDVAQTLGYSNPSKAVISHVDDEDKRFEMLPISDSQNGNLVKTAIINESGLYSLILSSKLPRAKEFKRWVTSEVLPSIRKHGAYMTPETLQAAILNPDTMIQLCQQLKIEQDKNRRLQEENNVLLPKGRFADSVSDSDDTMLIRTLAKILCQVGVDTGEKRLFRWMRENGYLIKRRGKDYNMPTQKSMELGLFRIKETVICHGDGTSHVNRTPKVTGKGQQYFVNLFLEKGNRNG